MIILILLIVFGGGYYAYMQLMPPIDQSTAGPIYSTQPVTRGNISVGVHVTGTLDPTSGGGIRIPGSREYSSSSIEYIIDEYLVEEGQEVKRGQVLVRLRAPNLKVQIENFEEKLKKDKEFLAELADVPIEQVSNINPAQGITLRAPIDGRVVGLVISEGQELRNGQIVARVVDDSRFRVMAKLLPHEFNILKERNISKMLLNFTQFEGYIEAEIVDINPNPVLDVNRDSSGEIRTSYVYWIELEADNPGLAYPGMTLRLGIPSASGSQNGIFWCWNLSTVDSFKKEERIISRADGLATRIHVHEMELVKKGDPIISLSGSEVQELIQKKLDEIRNQEMELRQLYAKLGEMEVTAPMDGVVAGFYRQVDETVHPGDYIGHIFNTSNMMMWVQVDDIDVLYVKQNAPVKVIVDAVPGEVFEGKVTRVSTMGQDVKGIPRFSVNIEVKGGPQLRPGMQAQAFIDAGSAENVLLIPVEAIFEEDGKPKVEVLNPDGTLKVVTIEIGLMNDRFAEVKSGLEEGELVVTGSSADLLPSQHIRTQDPLIPSKPGDGEQNSPEQNTRNRPVTN
jgi:multidrug efflux pump subunit AcrA (membrane-fusion protein)